MNSYKLVVAYDGSDYYGWQDQKECPSIARALNDAFQLAFKMPVKVLGASRTDAGVHAVGQVAGIKSGIDIDVDIIRRAWNNVLPPTVFIRSVEHMENLFNPFCNVKQKTYYYHFFIKRPHPFVQRYGYYYPYSLDMGILHQALQFFVGTHDFASFRSSEDLRLDTVRTIDEISLEYIKRYAMYRITIKGPTFLRHMIRRIVGASLAIASRSVYSLKTLEDIMNKRNPAHTLPNAPAKGLLLYKILYKNYERIQEGSRQ